MTLATLLLLGCLEPEVDLSMGRRVRAEVTPVLPLSGESARCLTWLDGDLVEDPTVQWRLDGDAIGSGPDVVLPDAAHQVLSCEATFALPGGVAEVARDEVVVGPRSGGNVLVVVLDDVGVDRLAAYGMGVDPPPTPTIDALAERSVRFTRAWATPSCSPTRATLLTGRHGFRTGIGKASNAADGYPLADSEVTFAELIRDEGPVPYSSAVVGKWHLGNFAEGHHLNPIRQGFDVYRGVPGNLRTAEARDGGPLNYYDYEYADETGLYRRHNDYLTTVEVDDAIDLVQTLPEPWLVYLSFHAIHWPAHIPPRELYSGPELTSENSHDDDPDRYDANLEALDAELGRLLALVGDDTTIILLGDNGTEQDATRGPYPRDEAKLSMAEGGIRIPLMVAGPWVAEPGTEQDALIHSVDVFATLAQLAGVPPESRGIRERSDSVSFLPYLVDPDREPLRELLYTERFIDNGFGPYDTHLRAVRDEGFKLLWDADKGYTLMELGQAWRAQGALRLDRLDSDAALAFVRLQQALDGPAYRRDETGLPQLPDGPDEPSWGLPDP